MDLRQNPAQNADTRRELVSVVIDDLAEFPFECAGFFVGQAPTVEDLIPF
jgi:hypothetical protein